MFTGIQSGHLILRAAKAVAVCSLVVGLACNVEALPGEPNPNDDPELQCSLPTSAIFDGGPGPDGIPALEYPEIAGGSSAEFVVRADDRVLGLEVNGVARAYPLRILWWHELINDTLGGQDVLVSYCPLTGSGLVFDPDVNGRIRNFGVSGLIYENNLMMFDRETRSLWNQLLLGSQCGPERGAELSRLPVVETTWEAWRHLHPTSTIVTFNTGYERDYATYPYGNYDRPTNAMTLFPSSPWDRSHPAKELVLGVHVGAVSAAYPFGVLEALGSAVALNDTLGGRPILVTYDAAHRTARAFDRRVDDTPLTLHVMDTSRVTFRDEETGSVWDNRGMAIAGPLAGAELEPLSDAYTLFWFSWSVFHPNTRLPDL
jgi:hypothetical protein